MAIQDKDELNKLLKLLDEIDYVHPTDIPNIDLYMDQVLTFLDQGMGTVAKATEDKAMTKTMINNYTKNQILPSPEKKKYSRDHMLNLIFIYYLKNFLSMKDIKSILDPINDKYFGSKEGLGIYDIYSQMVGLESTMARDLMKDVIRKYNLSRESFAEAVTDDNEKKELQDFAFICLLSFDVYVKKMMIEQFIEGKRESDEKSKENEVEK